MFSWAARKTYQRLLVEKAGVRLSDEDIRDEELQKLVLKIDFRSFKPEELLKLLDEKIAMWQRRCFKLGIWTSAPFLLLFLSLSGVDLKISLIGIKLSGIENLKEFIVLIGSVTGVAYQILVGGVEDLEQLRKAIFLRKYGKPQYDALYRTFPCVIPRREILESLFHRKYRLSKSKAVIEISMAIISLFSIAVFIGSVGWVYYVILADIWANSNLPPFWAKALVVFSTVIGIASVLVSIFKQNGKFTYIQREIEPKLKVSNKKTGRLTTEAYRVLKEEIKKEDRVKFFLKLITYAVVVIAAFYIAKFTSPEISSPP